MTLPNIRIFFFGFNSIVESLAKKLLEIDLKVTIITDEEQVSKNGTLHLKEIINICKDSKDLLTYLKQNKSSNNDIHVSIGCPWILKKEHISLLNDNIYNLHGTQLPKNRGGTIFSWQILMGNRVGMCLLHRLIPEVDSGPIVDYEEFIYPSFCYKPIDFIAHYEEKNIRFLFDVISKMIKDDYISTEIFQPEYLSSYLPRLKANINGWIDWSWDAQQVERFIRAFDEPYGGARCRLNNQIVIIRDAFSQSTDGYMHPFQSGLIYRNNKKWINVSVNGGELLVCSILDENGRNIISNVKLGDRLYSTTEDLVESKKRVIKSSKGLIVQ